MLVHSLSGAERMNDLFEYQLILRVRDEYGNPAGGFKGMDGYISQASAEAGGSPGSNVNDTLKLSHLPRSMFKKRGVKVSHC